MSLGLFTGCSKDNGGEDSANTNQPPTTGSIAGVYSGAKLSAKLNGTNVTDGASIRLTKVDETTVSAILEGLIPEIETFTIPKLTFSVGTKATFYAKLVGEGTDNTVGIKVTVNGTVTDGVMVMNVMTQEIAGTPADTEPILGVYQGTMKIDLGGTPETSTQKIYLSAPTDGESTHMKLEVRDFAYGDLKLGDIVIDNVPVTKRGDNVYAFSAEDRQLTLSLGTVTVDLNGTVIDGTATIRITVDAGGLVVNVDFTGETTTPNTEAAVKSMSIEGAAALGTPEIDGTTITFTLDKDATGDQLKLAPVFELSEGATITPKSGTVVDFGQVAEAAGTTYTVKAENGTTTQAYTVKYKKSTSTLYTFDTWTTNEGVSGVTQDWQIFDIPETGWDSSNSAVTMLKTISYYPKENAFPISKTTDAVSSNAAKIVTSDTKGAKFSETLIIPRVTSGTMFLGKFELDARNPLNSTKFGILFDKQPLVFRFAYKYTPGEKFFDGSEVVNGVEVPGKTDECAINAILYEVSDESETLTGENINDPAKITAIASLADGSEKTSFTSQSITFTYLKPYVSDKLYKLAVVMASSSEGDHFKGAPGSTLIVDNVEIVSK